MSTTMRIPNTARTAPSGCVRRHSSARTTTRASTSATGRHVTSGRSDGLEHRGRHQQRDEDPVPPHAGGCAGRPGGCPERAEGVEDHVLKPRDGRSRAARPIGRAARRPSGHPPQRPGMAHRLARPGHAVGQRRQHVVARARARRPSRRAARHPRPACRRRRRRGRPAGAGPPTCVGRRRAPCGPGPDLRRPTARRRVVRGRRRGRGEARRRGRQVIGAGERVVGVVGDGSVSSAPSGR